MGSSPTLGAYMRLKEMPMKWAQLSHDRQNARVDTPDTHSRPEVSPSAVAPDSEEKVCDLDHVFPATLRDKQFERR